MIEVGQQSRSSVMPIMRVNKRPERYTLTDNQIINNENLAPETLGVLVYLLSKPDAWDVNVNHLTRRFRCGSGKMYRILKDLRDAGYAKYQRLTNGRVIWDIYDCPQKPHAEKPHHENPNEENRHVLVSTEKEVITDNKPIGQTVSDDTFARWWEAYPKKVKKKPAREAWKRQKLGRMVDVLLADVENRKMKDRRWRDGYVPDPTTYLRQERWDDEIDTATPKSETVDFNKLSDADLLTKATAAGINTVGLSRYELIDRIRTS